MSTHNIIWRNRKILTFLVEKKKENNKNFRALNSSVNFLGYLRYYFFSTVNYREYCMLLEDRLQSINL